MKEKLGRYQRCGFMVGASTLGQTAAAANKCVGTGGAEADDAAGVKGCGES